MSKCFVTVGTTSFDALVEELNRDEVIRALAERLDVTELCIQYGRGSVKPQLNSTTTRMSAYDFKPNLAEDMLNANLIISHAGAGSIIEALRFKKPLIVVVNDALMDNHQVELARALEEAGHLLCAKSPRELLPLLLSHTSKQRLAQLTPYPEANPSAFAQLVEEEM